MRIYLNGRPKGHSSVGFPYLDIEPSAHGINILFSDKTGYYIQQREEISNTEIVSAITEIVARPRQNRVF